MNKIQIVVPCINLWTKYTKPCLDSINEAMMRAKDHGIDSRILLIDNASSDETKEEAGKLVSEFFAHQRNEERWGFQKSVNFGVKDGFDRGFDIVLICNNDIIMHPEALWRLTEGFAKERTTPVDPANPDDLTIVDVGMITCMDVAGEMRQLAIDPKDISRLLADDKKAVEEAPHPNFSAFAVTPQCWSTVGEFDELFAPAYFEDNDFHYRMKLAGIVALVYPPAMFFHFGSRTQVEAAEDGRPIVPSPMFENNRAEYVRKWGGQPGHEQWSHPYNDEAKAISSTKQNS